MAGERAARSLTPEAGDTRTRTATGGGADADFAASDALVADVHRTYHRTGDPSARERLLLHYRPLAHHFARKYANRGEPIDDLDQVAMLALVKALDRFDPEREVKFSTYAARVISGELKRHFRDRTWAVRVPRPLQERYLRVRGAVEELQAALDRSPTIGELARHLALEDDEVLEAMEVGSAYRLRSLDAPVGDDGEHYVQVGEADPRMGAFEDRLHRSQLLVPLLEKLSDADRLVIGLYYLHGLSQAEIARRLDVSQVQISRRLARILQRLRTLAESMD